MTLIEALARGQFAQAWEEAKREWRLVTLEAGLGLLAVAVGCGLAAAPDQKQPDLPLKTDPRVGDTVDSKLFGQDEVFFSNMFSSAGLEVTGTTGVLPISPDLGSKYRAVQIVGIETRDNQPFTYILVEDRDGNVTQEYIVWLADKVNPTDVTAYKLVQNGNIFKLQESDGKRVEMGSGQIDQATGELSQITLVLPDGKIVEVNQDWLNQFLGVRVAEAAEDSTATATATAEAAELSTLTPEPTSTWTPMPTPTATAEFTLTPAETPVEAPAYVLSFEGKMTEGETTVVVPFEIGLMKNMIERQDEPVKRILLNPDRPDGPDIMAEYLVKLFWYRYNRDNNQNISLAEYVKLLSEGGGQIDILVADPNTGGWDSLQKLEMIEVKYSPLQGIEWIYSDWVFNKYFSGKLMYVTIPEGNRQLTVVDNVLSTPDNFEGENRENLANFALTAQFVANLTDIFINAKPDWVKENGYVAIHYGNNAAYQAVPVVEKEYRNMIKKINIGDIEVITPQDALFIIEQ